MFTAWMTTASPLDGFRDDEERKEAHCILPSPDNLSFATFGGPAERKEKYPQKGFNMKHRTFTAELKRSGIALVLEQNSTRQQAADNLGIGLSTLDNWLLQHRRSNGAAHTDEQMDLKKRNAELEREVLQLMERDILKKATAYFAKDQL